jgi:hypothetical protein
VIAGKRVMLAFLVRIPGVSRRAAEAVAGFFQDLYQVRLADVADLADIPGVAPAEARLIATAVEDFLATEPEVPGAPQPTSPPRTPRKRPATFEPNVRQAFGAEPSSQKPAPVRRFATAAVPSHRPVGLEARRGLVNGGGLVNGRGRVNGLVNGLGYINGVVISELPLPRGNLLSRHLAIATALLVTFTIAAAFVETPVPSLGITIDGNFDDWARQGIPEYPGGTRSANPNVEIAGTSLFVAPSSVFLRVRVTGTTIFADPTEWDTAYAFLDIDGVNGTGYDLDDLGAEYAVRVSGSAGRVEDARLLRYDGSGRARDDWSGFVAASEVAAAATANQVEVSVPSGALQDFSEATLRVLFATDDNEGETSHTLVPVGSAAGALLVEQAPMTTVLSGGGQPFLTLTFRSLGNQPFVVEQVTIATQGNPILSGVPGGFTVAAGATETRTVNVDPAGALQGTLVTAAVAGVQVQPLRPYAVVGPPARAYVGQLPPGKVIDGLFGDWPSAVGDTDTATPRRRALNILGRDGNVSGNRVSLYGQFEGVVLEGGHAPGKPTKPRPPESGNGSQSAPGGPLPVVVGLDYVRFYLATDSATPGGYDVGGVSADRLLEVRGRNGRVRDASTFRFTGASWVRESALDVGVGADRIEVGATLVAASFNGTRFAVVSADWSGVGDVADAAGTRGADDAGTRAGRNPPVVLDVSGNGVFFLRDTNHGTETACTYNKVGSWTKGAGPVRSINLNSGETACWYIDQTRGVTIPTGTWETLLDLSSSGSPAYSVSVQIWNLGPNTVAETVVACNDQTTFGDDVRCFLDSVPQKNLGGSQVVRILLAYASGSGTVTIEYDDPDTTGDSRVTLPIPEFEGLAGALVTAVALVFALNYRRNRRRAVPHPHRPFAKILLA